MTRARLLKALLVVAGLVAVVIGGSILAMPEAFYAHSGIALEKDASLLSEIRAPGGALLGSGLLMLVGVFVPSFTFAGLSVAATIYLGYGASRLLSMTIDGVPDSGLITAACVELAIGVSCVLALPRAWPNARKGS